MHLFVLGGTPATRPQGLADGAVSDGSSGYCLAMDLGVTIFLTDKTIGPAELAREVEQRGFSSLWLPEHTHIPVSRRTPPPTGDDELPEEYRRCLDPLVALGAAASVTSTLRLGTGILLPAQREPIVTAKAVATLDHLSGGRAALGVGFGWNEDELEHHGVMMGERRAVARERVLAMQALWAEDEASFAAWRDGDAIKAHAGERANPVSTGADLLEFEVVLDVTREG